MPQSPCSLHSGWPPPNSSEDDGFDDTEGFVTLNEMDSMNSEVLWGAQDQPLLREDPASPDLGVSLPSCLTRFRQVSVLLPLDAYGRF